MMGKITKSKGNEGGRTRTSVKWVEKQYMALNTNDLYLFAHTKIIIRHSEAFHLKQEDLEWVEEILRKFWLGLVELVYLDFIGGMNSGHSL